MDRSKSDAPLLRGNPIKKIDFQKAYDLAYEGTRKAYEKNHIITDSFVTMLGSIRRRFEEGKLVIPLIPYYTSGIISMVMEEENDAVPLYGGPELLDEGDSVLGGKTYIGSVLSQDPVLGPLTFSLTSKFFSRDISYRHVFEKLPRPHFKDILAVILQHFPLYGGYTDLPLVQQRWEASSIAAQFSIKVVKAVDYQYEEDVFLATLLGNLGALVIFFHLPYLGEGRENIRCLRGKPSVKIDPFLFEAILDNFNPVVSAQIAEQLGFSETIVEIIAHQQKIYDTEEDRKDIKIPFPWALVKFVTRITDHFYMFGQKANKNLTEPEIKALIKTLGLSSYEERLIKVVSDFRKMDFGVVHRSLIDPESALISCRTDYEALDKDTPSYVLGPESVYFQVNLLQEAKDNVHAFFKNYYFIPTGTQEEYVERIKRIHLLSHFYNCPSTEELAKKIGLSHEEVLTELKKLAIKD